MEPFIGQVTAAEVRRSKTAASLIQPRCYIIPSMVRWLGIRRSVAGLLALLLLSACPDFEGLDVVFELELSDFERSMLEAECRRGFYCGSGKEIDAQSLEKCMEARAFLPERYEHHRRVAAAERGVVRYDAKAALACSVLLAHFCDERYDSYGEIADCQGVFSGTAPGESSCLLHEECGSGLCVGLDTSAAACSVGTCVAKPEVADDVDESCADRPCASKPLSETQLYCSEEDLCEPLKPRGASCASHEECDVDLWCPAGVCVRLTLPGDQCPCSDRLQRCHEETNTCCQTGFVGDPCTGAADCRPPFFCATQSLVCTEPPTTGDACLTTSDSEYICSGGSYCDLSEYEKVCMPQRAVGRLCVADDQCVTAYCDGESHKCQDIAECFTP